MRMDRTLQFTLDKSIHNTATMPFLPHSGPGDFDNWLMENIPYEPAKKLTADLEKFLGQKLQNRGEAHITVITPPEYSKILQKGIQMEAIDALAKAMDIQTAEFSVTCLGRSQVMVEDKMEQTYYIVLESPDLLKIRTAIYHRYVMQGGEPSHFDPHHWYGHITLGFTVKDFHEGPHGVKKGWNSCFAELIET